MTPGDRAGFVRFQQELAREALALGQLGAARLALRFLRPDDFLGSTVSEQLLAVLRDMKSTEDQVLRAVSALARLRPAGQRMGEEQS